MKFFQWLENCNLLEQYNIYTGTKQIKNDKTSINWTITIQYACTYVLTFKPVCRMKQICTHLKQWNILLRKIMKYLELKLSMWNIFLKINITRVVLMYEMCFY